MRCMSIAHDCVYLGCRNHAVYSHPDISDNYCYSCMMKTLKENGWGRNWKLAEWLKERCRRKLYSPKIHSTKVEKELKKVRS